MNDLRDHEIHAEAFDQQADKGSEQNLRTKQKTAEEHDQNIGQQQGFANMDLTVFLLSLLVS